MMLCKADFEDLFPDLFPPEVALSEGQRQDDDPINYQKARLMPGFANSWPAFMMMEADLVKASIVAAKQGRLE